MSLSRLARTYLLNQSQYAHLNAFNSHADPSVLLSRINPNPPPTGEGLGPFSVHDKPVAIKDNICTKYFKTTASSGILRDFTSPYDATVVKLLRRAGAVVVGKTNMDEFGMGSHSIHSHSGAVKMQSLDDGEDVSAGGSSGGSAVAVASGQCWIALGTDTGGSVRLPAAYTGVVGFKPSYGLISRWGVIAYANSLDTVGILGRNVRHIQRLFDKLNVHDPQDPTSLPPSTRSRFETGSTANEDDLPPLRIGIPLDYNISTLDPVVRKAWIDTLKRLSSKGHTLRPVRLPATQHALSAYYVLAPAEASSNLAKYDGVRYGSRAEGLDGSPESVLFANTRGQGFGPEVQRRILLGAFSLSAQAIDNYFIQAQKVRRLVQKDFDLVFAKTNPLLDDKTTLDQDKEGKVDVLLCPTAPTLAPPLSDVTSQDPVQAYTNDVFTVPASLAGLPAISVAVPFSTEEEKLQKRPPRGSTVQSVGIQIIGQYGDDKLVLDVAGQLQSLAQVPQLQSGPDMTAWGDSYLGESTMAERRQFGKEAELLGVSVKEAAVTQAAKTQFKKQKTIAALENELGFEHLDEMARLSNTTREGYLAKFVKSNRPLHSERVYSSRLLEQRADAEAGRGSNMTLDELTYHLTRVVGWNRIVEAAALSEDPPRRYIGRFLREADPVAAEREVYEKRLWMATIKAEQAARVESMISSEEKGFKTAENGEKIEEPVAGDGASKLRFYAPVSLDRIPSRFGRKDDGPPADGKVIRYL